MKKPTPKTAAEWGAVAPQYLGMFGLVACFALWAVTKRVEPAFLTAFGGLIAVGQGAEALVRLRSAPPVPPPLPDKNGKNGESE